MPAWGMHLYISNEINKIMKKDENEFLIGNVLPDMYGGWIIKDASKVLDYDISHCASKKYVINNKLSKLPDYEKFIVENYDVKIDTIFLGYLSHLIADYYFNNYAFKNHYINVGEEVVGVIDKNNQKINCNKNIAQKLKHNDFNYYSQYLLSKLENKKVFISDKIINSSLKIKQIDIQKEDLYKVEKYLNNLFCNENNKYIENDEEKYKMFSKQELEILVNNCVSFILKIFQEHSLI